jgi:GT2 family glycosyltransferase
MKVNIMTPYAQDKNLGKAYNEAMRQIDDHDWACLIDYDVMFLTSDAGKILHDYALRFPDAGMLTCYTNRIHPSSPQLLGRKLSEDDQVSAHIQTAERMRAFLYKATELRGNVSGFLMLIKKSVWRHVQFTEELKCLGVDTDYWKRLKAAGYSILRMDGLYVFHTYRIRTGIYDKKHLL